MPALRFLLFLTIAFKIDAAKILTVAPLPSLSHQIIYRPIHDELIRRGHEVTFITTNPSYPNGDAPKNLREIDVGPASYDMWTKEFNVDVFGKKVFLTKGVNKTVHLAPKIFGMQLAMEKVKKVIENNNYDLLILQGWFRATMLLSHLHKVPVVKISSFTMMYDNALTAGAPSHPLYHPNSFQQRAYNLTWWEQIQEVYNSLSVEYTFYKNEDEETAMLRRFYPDIPDLNVLNDNVDMLHVNAHPMWDKNRPMPPNAVYIGFIHQKPPKPLPKDIQEYMDSSESGVIYMSFGTNIPPSKLPQNVKRMFLKVFSELPYDVLWKFDEDLPDLPQNVKISKWFPQSDIFRHPNLKLIITQGGLQTAEEAIMAGVPVVCMPFLGDQWLNGENFVHHGVGKMLDIETVTEEEFRDAIVTVITDERYRTRMSRLRELVLDRPLPPLARVLWALEHALRHGGRHLRSPAANLPARRYYELDLLAICITAALTLVSILGFAVYYLTKKLLRMFYIRFSVKPIITKYYN
ncbi:UDP-glucosyltransferase 2 [Manduca sexta]|uniref:UDP-glucosyltransferase 2 n=1 Tax=Manduca sexta TaxID=7130 RepID=UPI00188F88C8|nr:UDP-glucosyltransferase 2 [Manduca sexta]